MANINGDSTTSDDSWFVPNFSEGFKGTRLQQGHDAEFRAVASGKPKPKVSWIKNGETLTSTSEKYTLSYDPESGRVSLLIRNLGPGDEGTYACTVSNAYGSTTATLSVNPDGNN
jgi:titin